MNENQEMIDLTLEKERNRNARRVIIIRFLGSLALVVFIMLNFTPTVIQGVIIILSAFLLLLANAVGLLFVFRNQTRTAILVSTVGLHIALLIIGILLIDMGFLIFIALLALTTLAVTNTVDNALARQAILAGLTSGLLVFVIDVILKNAPFRISIPEITLVHRFGWILIAALLLVNINHLYRQFVSFNLRTKLIITFVSVTLIAVGTLAYINIRNTEAALINKANESLYAAAFQTEDAILDFISDNLREISFEAQLPVFIEFLKGDEATRSMADLQAETSSRAHSRSYS